MNRPALAAAAAALFATAASAQNDAKEVVIKTTKVAGNVAMLEGQGGNIGVVYGDEGALVVDDQFAPLTAKIKAAVAALTNKPIRLVVNTHWHGDHTGGNENLAGDGAIIVGHDNVRKRLSTGAFMKALNRQVPPAPAKALPVVTFASEATLHFAGEEIHAVHVENAHTDGDIVLRFKKANVLHCGDTFFNGGYPFIDVDSGGSVDGYLAAHEKLLSLADEQTKIIPGHGPLGDKAALQAAHGVLKALRDRIKGLLDEGKTAEQIAAAKPSADTDAKWGQGFIKGDRIVDTIIHSLQKK